MSNCQQRIPFEVLSAIFKRISLEDCVQCSLTCYAWNAAARPIIFKSVGALTDRKMQSLKTLPTCNSRIQPLQDLVKVVTVGHFSDDFDVKLIDETFPYIEEIERSYWSVCGSKFRRLILEGGFPNLKSIPLLERDESYWDVILMRRKNIESLSLNERRDNAEMVNTILEKLDEFPQLQRFTASMNSSKNLEALLPGKLTSLRSVIFSFQERITDSSLLGIQPLENVRKIDITKHHLFANEGNFLLYLIKKFPYLDNLAVNWKKRYILRQLGSTSKDVLSRFFLYLMNVKSGSRLSLVTTNECSADIIYDSLNRVPYQRLQLDEKMKIQLKISFHRNWYKEIECNIVTYHDRSRDVKICEIGVEHNIIREGISAVQAALALLQQTEMNVEYLYFGTNDVFYDALTIPVDKILENCKNLNAFVLYGAERTSFSNLPSGFVSSLENMKLYCCVLDQNIFQFIGQCCPHLKVLTVDSCSFISEEDPMHRPHLIKINMPSISLDKFYFSFSKEHGVQPVFEQAFIKIETSTQKPRYCQIKWNFSRYGYLYYFPIFDNGKDHHTEKNYAASISDKHCVKYDICCKDISEFVLNTKYRYGDAVENIIL